MLFIVPFRFFGKSSGGRVSVRSYTRKNGVQVRAHTRGYPKYASKTPRSTSYKSSTSSSKSTTGKSSYYYNSNRSRGYYYSTPSSKPDSRYYTSVKADDSVTGTKREPRYRYNSQNPVVKNSGEPRTFPDSMKKKKYDAQGGCCAICGRHCQYEEMEGDHIVAYSKGGQTTYSNLQMLCRECNRRKSNK